jgi:AcrR family transcriptional regulator
MKSKIKKEPVLTRTQQARREDIIAAAIHVINHDGYAAASIDRIAKQANTTKSTVLYHFKSKQAINDALVESIYEDGAVFMKPYMKEAGSVRKTLKTYLIHNLKFIESRVDHIAAVHKVLQDVAPRDFNEKPVLWLKRLLEKGQQNGELGTFDPTIMATMIRSIIDSVSFHAVAFPSLDMNAVTHEIVQMFDKAIKP